MLKLKGRSIRLRQNVTKKNNRQNTKNRDLQLKKAYISNISLPSFQLHIHVFILFCVLLEMV